MRSINPSPIFKILRRILPYAGTALFAAMIPFAVEEAVTLKRPWYEYLLLAGALVSLAVAVSSLRGPSHKLSERGFLFLILFLFAGSRLAWVLCVDTIPVSDFATYNKFAILMSNDTQFYDTVYGLSRNMSVQPWGYPWVLGMVYKIFGAHLLVGKLLNIATGCLTVLVIYWLGALTGNSSSGRIAAVLFTVWPAQLMMTSVLASEHLGTLATLAAFCFLILIRRAKSFPWKYCIIAGVVMAFAATMRHSLLVVVICGSFASLLAVPRLKRAIATVSVIAVSFAGFYLIYLGAISALYHYTPVPRFALNLMIGMNSDSTGRWNPGDSQVWAAHPDIDDADRFAVGEAPNRIKASPVGFVGLMARKVPITWASDQEAAYWSVVSLDENSLLNGTNSPNGFFSASSQCFHIMVVTLAACGCFVFSRRGYTFGIGLLLIFVLVGTALHTIWAAQPRYHYTMEPALLLFIAFAGLSKSSGQSAAQVK